MDNQIFFLRRISTPGSVDRQPLLILIESRPTNINRVPRAWLGAVVDSQLL
jgi:hypothetical protein